MIKGSQKQMIVVRTGDSRYFDEAYFVLRRDVRPGRGEKTDLLTEANRILHESQTGRPSGRPCRLRAVLLFALGLLLGAGAALLICLLVL